MIEKEFKCIDSLDFPEMNGFVKVNDEEVLIDFQDTSINKLRKNLDIVENFLYSVNPSIEKDPTGINNRVFMEFTPSHSEYWDCPVIFFHLERLETDEELKTRIETHEESRYEYSITIKDRIIKDSMYIKDKALIQEIANHYNEVSKNV
jgi:hypothetical protein